MNCFPNVEMSKGSLWVWTNSLEPHVAFVLLSKCLISVIQSLFIHLISALLTRFYQRCDAEDAIRFVNGTRLDDRIVRTDWDAGFVEGRQYGRGKTGGQVSRLIS